MIVKKRFKKRICKLNNLYESNVINYKEYNNKLSSYEGHLKWGNCKGLLYRYKKCLRTDS